MLAICEMIQFYLLFFVVGICAEFVHPDARAGSELKSWNLEEETTEFWRKQGIDAIKKAKAKKRIETKAKNVILFIGDGMGVPSMTAGRILINGEEHVTNMDSLDFTGLVKTYNVDFQVPDSAGTATAYLAGVKGRYGTLGVNAGTVRHECSTLVGNEVETVMEKAYKAGMSVGLVTTTYITHASPAAAYAKCPNRGWYADKSMWKDGEMPEDRKPCKDIAMQLYEASGNITVLMGGGRQHFYKNDHEDGRADDNDFIANWKADPNVKYIETRDELFAYENSGYGDMNERLVGLFSEEHLEYDIDRAEKAPLEPSLFNMTEAAIRKLQQNPNGFYLFIEGGKIDHGHHDTLPIQAMYDFVSLDAAIGKAKYLVNLDETLIMVSADHSHTFSIGGYSRRGESIFGVGTASTYDDESVLIIGYANGPGYKIINETNESTGKIECRRELPSVTENERANPEQNTGLLWPTGVNSSSETHGGDDVVLMAQGPWAHLAIGINEQVHVAHVAEMALCLGDYENEEHCISSAFSVKLSLTIFVVCRYFL